MSPVADSSPSPSVSATIPRYGLDIETDTTVDGLDPAVAAVVGVAVVGSGPAHVLDGPEARILTDLDALLASLPPGVIVTWNGGAFDLPFLARRADHHGIDLDLRLRHDPHIRPREPLPGSAGTYRAVWGRHRHLDGYRLFRADVGASLGYSCALKSLARTVGLDPVEVDRTQIHRLTSVELHDYVASDARLTRALVDRRWPTASRAIDDVDFVLDG